MLLYGLSTFRGGVFENRLDEKIEWWTSEDSPELFDPEDEFELFPSLTCQGSDALPPIFST